MNKQEFINELITVLAAYVLFFFTEYVWDYEIRYKIGWI